MKYSYLLGKFHYCFHAQLLFLPRLLIIPISCKIKKKRKSVQYRITLYSLLLLFLFLLLLLLFFFSI